ncbi:hypothetical protein H3V53_01335 [Paraburkholderia bengalensis]|uniref:Uncharacterized protein n=1 Tax=Paraburkholderia bengalensis TaxID=2747562 RepID=A0ABU8IK87_9BURK
MYAKLASKLANLFTADVAADVAADSNAHIEQLPASMRRADLEPHGRFYEANHNPFAFYEETNRY